MDAATQTLPGATIPFQPAPRVLIAVPFYKNEHLVGECLGALMACAEELGRIGGRVVCYNDSPDYLPLGEALAGFAARAAGLFDCEVINNARNLGFVKTMNQAVAAAIAARCDLVMLNSDARVTPGALAEMADLAGQDRMTGFVMPRSNNATIATLPLRPWQTTGGTAAIERAHARFAELMPRASVVPTCVGFCMWIRWHILAEFGGFDEIYGHGYNEENDLVMRAARCGYRAIMANHALVWHEGEATISTTETDRASWERTNRAILDARYPEYGGYTGMYFEAPEALAEQLIAALIPGEDGKLDLAFDFSSFRAAHNGTFQAGYQLLREARAVWGDDFRLHVICSRDAYDFHGYAALGIDLADPHERRRYAVMFRVGQPYDWNAVERMVIMGAVIGIFMLDTISIDCPQLASAKLFNIWQFTLDHYDFMVAQSEHTRQQFRRRFPGARDGLFSVAHHSLHLGDYVLPSQGAAAGRGHTLSLAVIGNHFHHKYLAPTANALAEALPEAMILAVGLASPGAKGAMTGPVDPKLLALPNLRGLAAGALTDAEMGDIYASNDAVVFPSHAEGFGFPLMNALAARKPVFLRRIPVFTEIHTALGQTANMIFYDTTAELIEALRVPPVWVDDIPATYDLGTRRAANELRAVIDAALKQADYRRIAGRIRAVQFIADMRHSDTAPQPQEDRISFIARLLAARTERFVRRALHSRTIFAVSRAGFHAVRRVRRVLRGTR